jgi:hypothetical protein
MPQAIRYSEGGKHLDATELNLLAIHQGGNEQCKKPPACAGGLLTGGLGMVG